MGIGRPGERKRPIHDRPEAAGLDQGQQLLYRLTVEGGVPRRHAQMQTADRQIAAQNLRGVEQRQGGPLARPYTTSRPIGTRQSKLRVNTSPPTHSSTTSTPRRSVMRSTSDTKSCSV